MANPPSFVITDKDGKPLKSMRELNSHITSDVYVAYRPNPDDETLWYLLHSNDPDKSAILGSDPEKSWVLWTDRTHASLFEVRGDANGRVSLKWPAIDNVYFVATKDFAPGHWSNDVDITKRAPDEFFISSNHIEYSMGPDFLSHPIAREKPDKGGSPWVPVVLGVGLLVLCYATFHHGKKLYNKKGDT